MLQMHANEREEIKEVRAGDIAAAVGLKDVTTGDTLCDPTSTDHPRTHDLPGAGDLAGGRAEDQGRPGKDGHRAEPACAGRSVVPRADRRRIGPDHHLGHGRAAPGNHRRPHEARVQAWKPTSASRRWRIARRSAARSKTSKASSSSSPVVAASTVTSVITLEPNEPGKGYEFVECDQGRRDSARIHPGGGQGHPGNAEGWRAGGLSRSSTSR